MTAKVAKIVFSQDYLSQTGAIGTHSSPVTMFSPLSDGLFRLSAYLNAHNGDPGEVAVSFFYTDDFNTIEIANLNAIGGGNGNSSFVFRALASFNISFETNDASSGSIPTYNLSIRIEEL